MCVCEREREREREYVCLDNSGGERRMEKDRDSEKNMQRSVRILRVCELAYSMREPQRERKRECVNQRERESRL